MRIAIYYHNNFGRNDGPPLYYLNCLQKIKDAEVVHIIPDGNTSIFGKFDYHFWVDYGEDGLPVDHDWKIPEDGGKTIYVSSDTHLDDGYRLKKAQEFDYAFFNQDRALYEYLKTIDVGDILESSEEKVSVYNGIKKQTIAWLPHAAEPEAYPHFNILKKYDVAFIGHFQDRENYNGMTRVDALDRLFKEFPNFYFGTRNPVDPSKNMFEDASKKFCQSKVVFNISIGDDVNMRVFETLSSGSFLLTNLLPTLGELFEDGKHLVTYKTYDEMIEKCKYFLEHDNEREAIAKAGHEEFMSKHTYMHRVKKIFEILGVSI